MKHPILLLVISLCTGLALFAGCAAVQHAADRVAYDAGGPLPASTQPSQSDNALHNTSTVAGTVYPPLGTILGGIVAIATLVSAGAAAGARIKQSGFSPILSEVATAATGFSNGPWSPQTSAALQSAGLHDVAADPSTGNSPAVPISLSGTAPINPLFSGAAVAVDVPNPNPPMK